MFRSTFLALAVTASCNAQMVLIHDDIATAPGGFMVPSEQACMTLGWTCMNTPDFNTFTTMLSGGMWDMAVVNHVNQGGVPTPTDLDAVETYLNGGGTVIFQSWNLVNQGLCTHSLFTTMEVDMTACLGTSARDMHVWDPMSPLIPRMMNPTTYQDIVGFGVDMIPAEPMGTSTAPMGFDPMPTTNQAALVARGDLKSVYMAHFPHMVGVGGSEAAIHMEDIMQGTLGPSATITSPAGGATVMDDVTLVFDLNDPQMDPLTCTFEFSTDAGMTWLPCTAAASSPLPNPTMTPIATPATGEMFVWDSITDGVGFLSITTVDIRISVFDGVDMGMGRVQVDVDNVVPLPVCMVQEPMGTQGGDIVFDVTLLSISALTVDFIAEFSTDGGMTWNPATASAASQWPTMATGVPIGLTTWTWDSRTDGVALGGLLPGAILRIQVSDVAAPIPGVCQSGPFDVDNTSLCSTFCGDCDENMNGPDVLDALTAAQIAAGLVTPTMGQQGCCDVNSSGGVDVLDALSIAQEAAGLMPGITCP